MSCLSELPDLFSLKTKIPALRALFLCVGLQYSTVKNGYFIRKLRLVDESYSQKAHQ